MNFLSPQMKKPAANQAKAVVLPVACAGTAPAALAVGKGPETILQASQVLSTCDVETNTDLNDLGLLTLPRVDCPPEPQASVEEVFNQAVQHYRKNRLVAAVGVKDLIVVETPDAVMVCDRNHAQDVKSIVEELKRQGRTELL